MDCFPHWTPGNWMLIVSMPARTAGTPPFQEIGRSFLASFYGFFIGATIPPGKHVFQQYNYFRIQEVENAQRDKS